MIDIDKRYHSIREGDLLILKLGDRHEMWLVLEKISEELFSYMWECGKVIETDGYGFSNEHYELVR